MNTKQEAPVSAGVWVKANERLPQTTIEDCICRWVDTKRRFISKFDNEFKFHQITDSHFSLIEWLDESPSVQGEGLREALLRKVTEDIKYFESIKLTEHGQGGCRYAKDVLRIIEKAYREGMIEGSGTTLTTDEAWKQFYEANNLNHSSPSGQEKDAVGWVKVSENKHPEDEWVLLYNGHWRGVGKYNKADNDDEPEWQDETSEYISPYPTHWRPLPEPPK